MILPDVNVLVYAFRREQDTYDAYSRWLLDIVNGQDELGLHDAVLAGFVRAVTSPRIMAEPAPPAVALDFVERLTAADRGRWLATGPSVWTVMRTLVDGDRLLRGNLVPDALLAATAIAHGCRLATADRGFARFPGLRFFDPVAA